jgi:hypothetical protein
VTLTEAAGQEAVLETLRGRHPLVAVVLQYRKLSRLRSVWHVCPLRKCLTVLTAGQGGAVCAAGAAGGRGGGGLAAAHDVGADQHRHGPPGQHRARASLSSLSVRMSDAQCGQNLQNLPAADVELVPDAPDAPDGPDQDEAERRAAVSVRAAVTARPGYPKLLSCRPRSRPAPGGCCSAPTTHRSARRHLRSARPRLTCAAEIRVLAHYAGADCTLARLLRAGGDVHRTIASTWLGNSSPQTPSRPR